jgi:hypothetical protein
VSDWKVRPLPVDENVPIPIEEEVPEEEILAWLDRPVPGERPASRE